MSRSKKLTLEHKVPEVSTPEILLDILGPNDKVFKMRNQSSRNVLGGSLGGSSLKTPEGQTSLHISGVGTTVFMNNQIERPRPKSARSKSTLAETMYGPSS